MQDKNNNEKKTINLTVGQKFIDKKMSLVEYMPSVSMIDEDQEKYNECGRKILEKLQGLVPEITKPEMTLLEKDAFLFSKSDYLFIYPEMIDALLDAGLIEDLGSARSIHYYGLFDKLFIEITENNYIITDRYLYTRTGEVLDLSETLKNFALYNNGYSSYDREQVKFSNRVDLYEYFGMSKTISLTRLLVVLMENGDIINNPLPTSERRYISNKYEVHHDGMTWCNTCSKLA